MNDTKIKLQDIYNRLDALFDEDGDWHTLVKNTKLPLVMFLMIYIISSKNIIKYQNIITILKRMKRIDT